MKDANFDGRIALSRREVLEATPLPGQTIDFAIRNGELPAIRSGRRLIILREDLVAWLHKCRARGQIPVPNPSQAERERFVAMNRGRKRTERAT